MLVEGEVGGGEVENGLQILLLQDAHVLVVLIAEGVCLGAPLS